MNKEEFLQQFKKNLINISDTEKEDAVRYYTEYFEEAGEENEQKVIEELGSPVMLARKLSAEAAIKDINIDNVGINVHQVNSAANEEKKDRKSHEGMWGNVFTIVLLLCSFPIWLPLSIVAAVLVFVVILIAFIFVFCIVIVGAALVVSGTAGVLAGFAALFVRFINGITVIGAGLFMAGLGALVFIAGRYLVKGTISLIVALGKRKTSRM